MTKRQQQLWLFIWRYRGECGASPSFQEMADELGLASKSGVHRLIAGLIERGHLVQTRFGGIWAGGDLVPVLRVLAADETRAAA